MPIRAPLRRAAGTGVALALAYGLVWPACAQDTIIAAAPGWGFALIPYTRIPVQRRFSARASYRHLKVDYDDGFI